MASWSSILLRHIQLLFTYRAPLLPTPLLNEIIGLRCLELEGTLEGRLCIIGGDSTDCNISELGAPDISVCSHEQRNSSWPGRLVGIYRLPRRAPSHGQVASLGTLLK